MKLIHILLSATFILIVTQLYNQFKRASTPQRGFSITQSSPNNQGFPCPKNMEASLPIPFRKRWLKTTYFQRVWKKSKRKVKIQKTGKKFLVDSKQSILLSKSVLNPA